LQIFNIILNWGFGVLGFWGFGVVTAQPTMIRGIRGAEAACSVHESPFGADD